MPARSASFGACELFAVTFFCFYYYTSERNAYTTNAKALFAFELSGRTRYEDVLTLVERNKAQLLEFIQKFLSDARHPTAKRFDALQLQRRGSFPP